MHDDILITDMASFAFRAIAFCRELPSSDPRRFLDDVSIKRFEALPEHSPSLEENVRKCLMNAKDQFPRLKEQCGNMRNPGFRMKYLRANYPNIDEIKRKINRVVRF